MLTDLGMKRGGLEATTYPKRKTLIDERNYEYRTAPP